MRARLERSHGKEGRRRRRTRRRRISSKERIRSRERGRDGAAALVFFFWIDVAEQAGALSLARGKFPLDLEFGRQLTKGGVKRRSKCAVARFANMSRWIGPDINGIVLGASKDGWERKASSARWRGVRSQTRSLLVGPLPALPKGESSPVGASRALFIYFHGVTPQRWLHKHSTQPDNTLIAH